MEPVEELSALKKEERSVVDMMFTQPKPRRRKKKNWR